MASKELKIAITGANGFIGKNLTSELKNQGYINLFHITRDTTEDEMKSILKQVEFVFHLAGINRPISEDEFEKGNKDFTQQIIKILVESNNIVPIIISSSTQAISENAYGLSKKAAEESVEEYAKDNKVECGIYRLPNVFGKWSKPNYNSAIATFCHNIARNLPVQVNDPNVELTLVYIDDVVNDFIKCLDGMDTLYSEVLVIHKKKLGEIVELIYTFKASRENRSIPKLDDPLEKKLYSTYLSFLSEDQFSYELKMNVDQRGSFTEFIKTVDRGQVSINISKPGITKGNHWHHTKNEKFLVVSGNGVIRFRKPDEEKVIEYFVSGDKLEVVDIPVGYTHNIENLGETDMVTVMWVNEPFDPENPDTYFLEV